MIDRLKELFLAPAAPSPQRPTSLAVAAAALLVEVAAVDDSFEAAERERIFELIARRFALSEEAARDVVEEAARVVGESVQILRFTRTVKDRFSYEERVELIEMLWEVVYADDLSDAFENQLMRRIGGLIYVSDRDRGEARQRVLARRARGETRSVA